MTEFLGGDSLLADVNAFDNRESNEKRFKAQVVARTKLSLYRDVPLNIRVDHDMTKPSKPPGTLSDRIKAAYMGAGFDQSGFARAMGIARNTLIVMIRTGEAPEWQIEKIAHLTGRSRSWLRYGIVDAAEVTVERYVTGFEDAKDMAEQAIRALRPDTASLDGDDAKPSVADREVARTGTPALGKQSRKRPKQA